MRQPLRYPDAVKPEQAGLRDEEEFGPEHLDELRSALEALEAELREQLAAVQEGSAPVSLDEPIGRLSRMEALQQQQMAKANASAAKARLQLVARAFEAMQRDEYGECRSCEEAISLRRLRARPESPLCLRCQTAREA